MAKKTKKIKIKPNVEKPTSKQQCEQAHAGQSGYCDDAGGWHPII